MMGFDTWPAKQLRARPLPTSPSRGAEAGFRKAALCAAVAGRLCKAGRGQRLISSLRSKFLAQFAAT